MLFLSKTASGVERLLEAITTFTGNANQIIQTNGAGLIDASLLPPTTTGAAELSSFQAGKSNTLFLSTVAQRYLLNLFPTDTPGDYGFATNDEYITLINEGRYYIHYTAVLDKTSGSTRSAARTFLELNNAEINGTRSETYHRLAAQGETTAAGNCIIDANAGDQISLASFIISGNNVRYNANTLAITIIRLDGFTVDLSSLSTDNSINLIGNTLSVNLDTVTGGGNNKIQLNVNGLYVDPTSVKADISDFVESDYVHTFGNETIDGVKTFTENLFVDSASATDSIEFGYFPSVVPNCYGVRRTSASGYWCHMPNADNPQIVMGSPTNTTGSGFIDVDNSRPLLLNALSTGAIPPGSVTHGAGGTILGSQDAPNFPNLQLTTVTGGTDWTVTAGSPGFFDNWLLFQAQGSANAIEAALLPDGVFRVQNGVAGSPGHGFINASNYGMYYNPTNLALEFSTQGTNKLSISPTGILSVPDNYELIIGADDDIPNIKWVTDEIANSLPITPFTDYVERLTSQSTSTPLANYITYSVTIPRDGVYEVHWSNVLRATATNRNYRFRIQADGIDITNPGGDGWIEDEIKDAGGDIRRGHSGFRRVGLTAGTFDLTMDFGEGSGNLTMIMYYGNISITEIL